MGGSANKRWGAYCLCWKQLNSNSFKYFSSGFGNRSLFCLHVKSQKVCTFVFCVETHRKSVHFVGNLSCEPMLRKVFASYGQWFPGSSRRNKLPFSSESKWIDVKFGCFFMNPVITPSWTFTFLNPDFWLLSSEYIDAEHAQKVPDKSHQNEWGENISHAL